jgi:hypothetical protein
MLSSILKRLENIRPRIRSERNSEDIRKLDEEHGLNIIYESYCEHKKLRSQDLRNLTEKKSVSTCRLNKWALTVGVACIKVPKD